MNCVNNRVKYSEHCATCQSLCSGVSTWHIAVVFLWEANDLLETAHFSLPQSCHTSTEKFVIQNNRTPFISVNQNCTVESKFWKIQLYKLSGFQYLPIFCKYFVKLYYIRFKRFFWPINWLFSIIKSLQNKLWICTVASVVITLETV